MIFISFSDHIREDTHKTAIEAFVGRTIEEFIHTERSFDTEKSFVPQVSEWLNSIDFEGLAVRKKPIVVFLPSLNYIAAILLAQMHGRIGSFPSILRVKSVDRSGVRVYEIAEVINLNEVRDQARGLRPE